MVDVQPRAAEFVGHHDKDQFYFSPTVRVEEGTAEERTFRKTEQEDHMLPVQLVQSKIIAFFWSSHDKHVQVMNMLSDEEVGQSWKTNLSSACRSSIVNK